MKGEKGKQYIIDRKFFVCATKTWFTASVRPLLLLLNIYYTYFKAYFRLQPSLLSPFHSICGSFLDLTCLDLPLCTSLTTGREKVPSSSMLGHFDSWRRDNLPHFSSLLPDNNFKSKLEYRDEERKKGNEKNRISRQNKICGKCLYFETCLEIEYLLKLDLFQRELFLRL